MKKILVLAVLLFASVSSYAGNFAFTCHADVSCKDLFPDMVTDKFMEKFPNDQWAIFVIGRMSPFSDGAGVSYAEVGVVPTNE